MAGRKNSAPGDPLSSLTLCTAYRANSRASYQTPMRLLLRHNFGLQRFGLIVARVDVNECLAVGVMDDVATGILSSRLGGGKRQELMAPAARNSHLPGFIAGLSDSSPLAVPRPAGLIGLREPLRTVARSAPRVLTPAAATGTLGSF
jgi:hypothetical protein